jgi:hypothetical protein
LLSISNCSELAAFNMRHILVDAARKRGTGKRGGKFVRMNLDEVSAVSPDRGREAIALDEALTRLAELCWT